jgi:hypothetical protein
VEEEDQKVLMDRVLRQRADNERNIWKRRTVKRIGLPIVRFEDFYEQGHPSDEDRLFEPWYFDNRDWLNAKDREFLRLRNGIPGVSRYVNTIPNGAPARELEQLSYVFDEMVMLTLADIGVHVRDEDTSVKEKMREPVRTVPNRIYLGGEIRSLRDAFFENFEDGLIWMYQVVRLHEITGYNAPIEWRRAKEVMEHFMRVVERAAFDERGDLVQKVWIALYHKLRVYFHTTLEVDERREIFEEGSQTWRCVSRLLLGARAYCRLVRFNREETSLFMTAVLSPRERGLLY